MHVVQSPEWGQFKTEYGTKAHRVGEVQFTLHKLPFTNYFYAYAPKVNPEKVEWTSLEQALKEKNCVAINFDVPYVTKGSNNESTAVAILEKKCKKSPRNTFTKYNIVLKLEDSLDEILKNMKTKQRYNIKYAQKKGVTTKTAKTKKDFEIFYELISKTAERQKYYIHPKSYYQALWKLFGPEQKQNKQLVHIITSFLEEEPLASWMFFVYEDVIYYPYGGSSEKHRNLQGSTLVGWEGIKLGKKLNCRLFDFWGACKDPQDKTDPEYGFTNFKLKYGGTHVEYIDSYDFIINPSMYHLFNVANEVRWKILKSLK